MIRMPIAILAVAGALAAAGAASTASAEDVASSADRSRFECRAVGADDISMKARYETRGSSRRKFTNEFEADPRAGFSEGQRLIVSVDGVNVARPRLEALVGGDLVFDVNFDTNPTEADADPFPANFPSGVGRGTDVRVLRGERVLLGCTLRR